MHPLSPAAAAAMDFSQNSLFGYMEDLQELTIIERPVRRSLKTPEEIERLTVDEDLSDIERAVYLLSAGQDIQGTSVIANLPLLMRQNPAETLRRVLPKVRCLPRSMRMHTYLPREYGSHYVCPEGVTLWRRNRNCGQSQMLKSAQQEKNPNPDKT
ncbi:serine/threonine-protein phosphatase 4 regulatory subunit 4 isoform X1 [Muntiacus reevesi]|uniref:serine/threonine-protein phosphatase 4 regulatory subunit 4 isoform X5 n=1 Tax=Cervus canadensis TaxID=1574408 RepID=UPI0018BED81D|nr:serine/threonine-protein phosphatase 4 regulatory subunit 4 isoform X5 [Cervus canadensis]XP_043778020.1 serine/threonine-protein phosphatase 4 regulatory subunit 4 isoform X5 [Cervus elaphus]XP_061015677.1 serine/threonine-protein phosphatase 4 regulatory subunit 4 isoform X3 [Dama dama]